MKVLVTGVAGCLGSHIADRLIERGHDVCGIDNLLTGRRENVHPKVAFAEGDIAHDLSGAFDRCDTIVHCAASYDDGSKWLRDARTNTLGTVAVCDIARSWKSRVIYLQTALCYGHNPLNREPVPEHKAYEYMEHFDPKVFMPPTLKLTQPINPDNSYSISKTAGESYLIHSGLDYVSLRLANIYGPRNLSGPVPVFYQRLTEGKQCKVSDARRDFLHVDDFLRVAIPAVEGKGSGVYHVASGTDDKISSVYQHVQDALGMSVDPVLLPRQKGEAASILLDPERTKLEFGWTPKVTLADGIKTAVDWYKANGVERTFTHLRQD